MGQDQIVTEYVIFKSHSVIHENHTNQKQKRNKNEFQNTHRLLPWFPTHRIECPIGPMQSTPTSYIRSVRNTKRQLPTQTVDTLASTRRNSTSSAMTARQLYPQLRKYRDGATMAESGQSTKSLRDSGEVGLVLRVIPRGGSLVAGEAPCLED